MIDLRDISHYLRIQINHIVGKKITFYSSTYLKKVLDYFKMTECKPASIPMDLLQTLCFPMTKILRKKKSSTISQLSCGRLYIFV